VIRKIRPQELAFSTEEHTFMSRHLYRFFNEAAVKRSMRCEWSEDEGGVTSRGEQEVLALLEEDEDYNFPTSTVEGAEETPTGALPPAQYQAGEDDSISTFRHNKAAIRKVTTADTYSAGGSTVASASESKTQEDDSTIKTKSTAASKKTKKSTSSKSTSSKSTTGVTSELTTSISQMNSSVHSMQIQFVALMSKLDTMNTRVGALEVVRPAETEKPESPVAPAHPPEKGDGPAS